MKTLKTIMLAAASALAFAGCDKFLDVMPDNRTELDTKEKIQTFLTSAYPATDYMLLTEYSSDNVDNYGQSNPNTDRFIDQVFAWQDITETNNESDEMVWERSYIAIAAANQAIEAIEDMGGAEEAGYTAEMAEALICRAYSHFVLVNIFAKHYNSETSATDPGITYMLQPEQGLDPKYERNSVAEVYDYMDKDIQAALPWISDGYYTVPKYHFNKKAAYAFAAKFYIFYEKYDLALKYADMCLGSQPSTMLRDWLDQSKMTQDSDVLTEHYIDAKLNCNLMLLTAYSTMGMNFGPYRHYSRYSHGNYLAQNEDGIALTILLGTNNSGFYYSPMKVYTATNLDKVIFWKLPYLFEYTDPVAGIGYNRTVYPAFTSDYLLLERAEAKIMLKRYDEAAEDMNIWMSNISKKDWDLTVEEINDLVKDVDYSKWNFSTIKKRLNPKFEISEGVQENLLHFCLLLKRIEGLGSGLRWFDVKRYGIEIERREMGEDGNPLKLLDVLAVDDGRRALQIPKKVIDAGYEANRRKDK
ncbi:MAG: RagB/SusD family nutrient uptake outer membrane protein [Bacteroidales bacterium]|nr:RagB/SusD family nutrient uptake outer membrane protein [Bacteroidales bacterium]